MSRTIDQLQKHLQKEVFHYAQDGKKAAGRALGTIIEIITYYKLCAWGFSKHILIEKRIPEFGRDDIRHNVEFSLHRTGKEKLYDVPRGMMINGRFLAKIEGAVVNRPSEQLMSSTGILRNAAVISETERHLLVADLMEVRKDSLSVLVAQVDPIPRAIFECKRVGVEEGMKKGPQSIEKAKQGAYVARSVSALQKIIDRGGNVLGYLPTDTGEPIIDRYDVILAKIVTREIEAPEGFVLTVGVTSNHGNWFTAEDHNKELRVLAAAYDWLLFLTDEGLCEFVEECMLGDDPQLAPVKKAFLESYSGKKGGNRFTKTRIDLDAHQALRQFFVAHDRRSDGWFNVITPRDASLPTLSEQLRVLVT